MFCIYRVVRNTYAHAYYLSCDCVGVIRVQKAETNYYDAIVQIEMKCSAGFYALFSLFSTVFCKFTNKFSQKRLNHRDFMLAIYF